MAAGSRRRRPRRSALNVRWIIDGNNVFGSRPDGWWNDRDGAANRFAQQVAEWCRTHGDDVTIVFDAPVSQATLDVAGGNLEIVEAPRRGRNAADDHIVELVDMEAALTEATCGSSRPITACDAGSLTGSKRWAPDGS